MKRRTFIQTLGTAAGAGLLSQAGFADDLSFRGTPRTKPNILFIMTDQQSHTMMSCMGNRWLSTPTMDSIAGRGYRFDNTYCANPVCMPSRFSLLTGHHASDVGVKENTSAADLTKVNEIISRDSLGTIFRRAGYETLYAGKTHLYGSSNAAEYGFSIHTKDPYDEPARYAETILSEKGKTKSSIPFFLFLSFLNPHDICYKAGMDPRFPQGLSAANARETHRLLELQKSLSPEDYRRQIPPCASNPAPINGEHPNMVSMSSKWRTWNDVQWNLYHWMYHRLTESVDAQIGRVLTALNRSGLEDETIIVFTSDHGDMNGSHGLILKNVMFEECQRVPFIFAGPGIKRNVADPSSLVCNGLDLIPTLCDLVGIDSPKGLPGVSLKSYLIGEGKKPQRHHLITESYNSYQIHNGQYKYTLFELPAYPETLTDLVANPGETINYCDNPAYANIKSGLKQKLLADLSHRGLTPLPENRTIENIRAAEKKKNPKRDADIDG